jgi:hypothetical protein
MKDKEEFLMHRFFKREVIYRIAFWFIVAVFIVTAHPGTGSPKSASKSLDRSGTLTISGKTADSILVLERHFAVTESTTIINVKGKKIRLSDLAVPCNAEIEYRLRMDKDPLVLKITVKKVLQGATTQWPTPASES